MKAPQIILIVIYGTALLAAAYMHGKPHTKNFSFWDTVLGLAVQTGLLWWGGFFR